MVTVSYTHLDVYKRQPNPLCRHGNGNDRRRGFACGRRRHLDHDRIRMLLILASYALPPIIQTFKRAFDNKAVNTTFCVLSRKGWGIT